MSNPLYTSVAAEIDNLQEQNSRLRAMLERLQWSSFVYKSKPGYTPMWYKCCPICRALADDREHGGGCALAALLKEGQ